MGLVIAGTACTLDRETVMYIIAGSLAGAGCGFLGTMVGIGGPPLFLLYQYLDTPKEEVSH